MYVGSKQYRDDTERRQTQKLGTYQLVVIPTKAATQGMEPYSMGRSLIVFQACRLNDCLGDFAVVVAECRI